MRLLFVLLTIILLSGCALVGEYQQKSAEETAKGVLTYCAAVDEFYRLQFRAQVNDILKGKAEVKIDCN